MTLSPASSKCSSRVDRLTPAPRVFDGELEGLEKGAPVQLTLDLLYLGKPRQVTIPWTFGKPGENAKNIQTIVAQLAPVEKFAQIKQEHDARVERGIADCK